MKVYNLPILIVLGLLLAGLVTAGAVLYSIKDTITLTRPTLVSSLPFIQLASAGDYYEYGFNITNTANQANNLTTVYNISMPTLVSGNVKLRLMDNTSTVIVESSTVTGGVVEVRDTNRFLQAGSFFGGIISVEYNISAPNATYTLELSLEGGDDQFR